MTKLAKVDVVGVGLNATDTLIPVSHYPERGSKVIFRSANVLPGGQVATAMAACQSWGLQTRYVGKVGDDGAAALHRAYSLGWVGATLASVLLLALPLDLETRTVVALLCGPLVGIAVHLAALARMSV